MTDVQKILVALADCYHHGQIGEEDCQGVAKALNGVPEAYHMDAFKSFLGIQEDQPEEQPEDYLAVKTFTSNEFHIGDEVAYGKDRYVIYRFDEDTALVFGDGPVSRIRREGSAFERTGRNFPAIAAILEEIRK